MGGKRRNGFFSLTLFFSSNRDFYRAYMSGLNESESALERA